MLDYAERRYGSDMEIQEIGCATMNVNMVNPTGEENELTDYRPLWSKQ